MLMAGSPAYDMNEEIKHSLAAAYKRLTLPDLILFLKLRCLSTEGNAKDYAARLVDHDLQLYGVGHRVLSTNGTDGKPTSLPKSLESIRLDSSKKLTPPANRTRQKSQSIEYKRTPGSQPVLPPEIWATVMEYLDDFSWELSMALSFPTYMKRPADWDRFATPVDYAILKGSVAIVHRVINENDTDTKLAQNLASGSVVIGSDVKPAGSSAALRFSEVGATVMCRFGFTKLLSFFWARDPRHFLAVLQGAAIPNKASAFNQVSVLDWWFQHSTSKPRSLSIHNRAESGCAQPTPFYRAYTEDAMDAASRGANLRVLDWWKASGLPLLYSDASLEGASVRGHVDVLEWWKRSGLSMKLGRVMDLASGAGHVAVLDWWLKSGLRFTYKEAIYNASTNGRVNVLEWWAKSGLRLLYDSQALVGATLHDKPEALEWWKNSQLPIEYRICDIEEALEDAVGGGEGARRWWMDQAVNFKASNKEWAETKLLGITYT